MARERIDLTPFEKTRLGEFYLKRALVNVDRHLREPQTFDDIQQYLSGCAGVAIPQQLHEQLEFGKLNWQMVKHPDGVGLTLLFLGGLERDGSHINLDHTRSTIEVARKVDFVDGKTEYRPILVRIGGVSGNRAVGLTYDCDTKRLKELNVSLSKYEDPLREETSPEGISHQLVDQLTVDLPEPYVLNRGTDAPYHTAALITGFMSMIAYERSGFDGFHTKALVCQINNLGVTLGKPRSVQDSDRVKEAGGKLGYYVKRENGLVIVGRSKPQHFPTERDTWEISFPEKLSGPQPGGIKC
ncbi:MAG: hypothetical protein M1524_00630 [Patescibacteria group bacterium]|nr:hypothetical protein [Patescibacteria group bacterium]